MARETMKPSGMENPEDWHADAPELDSTDSPAKKLEGKRDSGIWEKDGNTYESVNPIPGEETEDDLISPEEAARLEMKRAERAQAIKDEAAIAQARMEAKMDKAEPASLEVMTEVDLAVERAKDTARHVENAEAARAVDMKAPELRGTFDSDEEMEVTDDMITEVEEKTIAHVDPEAAKARLAVAEARLQELTGAGGVAALELSLKEKYGYDATDVVGRSGIMGKMKTGFKSMFNPGFSAMKKTYEMRLAEKNALQDQIATDRAIVADPKGFEAKSKKGAALKRLGRPSKASSTGGGMTIGRKGPQ